MKTLPNRKKPLTASQYVQQCQARRDSAACRRIDRNECIIRAVWIGLAISACGVCLAGLIHSALPFIPN